MYIYGLCDPITQELRYVGFTSRTLKARLNSGHLSKSELKPRTYKNNWIKSLLKQDLKPEIFAIQQTNEKEWQEDEQFNIAYFRSIGCRLTNATDGGEGMFGHKRSPESIEKTRQGRIGKKHSYETKKLMSSKAMGKQKRFGAVLSEETKSDISKSLLGNTPWNKGIVFKVKNIPNRKFSDDGKRIASLCKIKIDDNTINNIKILINANVYSLASIAKQCNVSRMTVSRIRDNKLRKWENIQ